MRYLTLLLCILLSGCLSSSFEDISTEAYTGHTKPIIRVFSTSSSDDGNTITTVYGSGFITEIENQLYIISANHVIVSNGVLSFETHDNKILSIFLQNKMQFPSYDVVVMQIKKMSATTTPYILNDCYVDQKISVNGFPNNGNFISDEGIVIDIDDILIIPNINKNAMGYTNAVVKSGMSGGPVLNVDNEVIGMISSIVYRKVDNVYSYRYGMFLKIDSFIPVLKHHLNVLRSNTN